MKYVYKTLNKNKLYEKYSETFPSLKKAEEWYDKHGKWLEKTFNRTLKLFDY